MTSTSTLTPSQRQQILRRLKYGPVLSRDELAGYANRVRQQVLSKRKKEKSK
jgi:hypothetical protein